MFWLLEMVLTQIKMKWNLSRSLIMGRSYNCPSVWSDIKNLTKTFFISYHFKHYLKKRYRSRKKIWSLGHPSSVTLHDLGWPWHMTGHNSQFVGAYSESDIHFAETMTPRVRLAVKLELKLLKWATETAHGAWCWTRGMWLLDIH